MILFDRYGADAFRFYLMASPVMNADNMNFLDKNVDETYKKVMVLLYNVNNFYGLYIWGLSESNTLMTKSFLILL